MEVSASTIQNPVANYGQFAFGVQTKNSATVSIKTQEGDVVDLSFHNSNSYSNSTGTTNSNDGSSGLDISSAAAATSKYSISVQGSLSQQETDTIKKLADALTPIAQNFFTNSGFDLANAATSLAGSMGSLQEVSVKLEQTVTQTFAGAGISTSTQNGNQQPSTTADTQSSATGAMPDQSSSNSSASEGIKSPSALASAVVETVFQKEGNKVANGDPLLLRGLSDFVQFLKDGLSKFLKPLEKIVQSQKPPIKPEDAAGEPVVANTSGTGSSPVPDASASAPQNTTNQPGAQAQA